MKLNSYQEILEYYLSRSQEVCSLKSSPIVLKTDLFNEAHSKPRVGGIIKNLKGCGHIIGIEAQDVVTGLAKQNLGNGDWTLLTGDIRNLPFKDKSFSVILDLSTLDHIKPDQVESVLAGYNRVLDDTGAFFLVTWINTLGEAGDENWNANNQYYFDQKKLESSLNKYFSTVTKDHIYTDPSSPSKQLFSYLLTVWHGSTS